MKKVILSLLFLILCTVLFAQVESTQIKYGDFAPKANYQTLINQGHGDFVQALQFYVKNGYSNDSRYSFVTPSGLNGENLVDFVTVDPARNFNRSVHLNGYDGIFLNPHNREHHIGKINATGFMAIVGCGNVVTYYTTFSINKKHQQEPYVQNPDFGNQSIDIPAGGIWSDPVPTQTLTGNLQRDITSIPLQKQEEVTFDYNPCETYWRSKYPHMFAAWDLTGKKSSFYGPDRMAMRKCVTGRSYVWRNAGWLIPLAGVTIFSSGDLITDGNIDWNWKKERDIMGTPDEYWDHNPSGPENRNYQRIDYGNQPRGIVIPIFN
jgi:hypothetical protein